MDFLNYRTTDSYDSFYPTATAATATAAAPAVRTEKGQSGSVSTADNLILRSLPKDILEALRPYIHRLYVKKEQFLFQQDDEMEVIYFPETAVLSELHILDDGRMVEVSITGREGTVGIAALYQPESRIANCVQVTQPGSVLKIDRATIKKIGAIYPQLLMHLHRGLDQYIRQISQKAVCNMYHSVAERFCTWLLMLQDRTGNQNLKLTHEQIARTLGVYRPSVTCIALEMKKNKLIEYSRGRIAICDRERIEEIACNCYAELGDLSLSGDSPNHH